MGRSPSNEAVRICMCMRCSIRNSSSRSTHFSPRPHPNLIHARTHAQPQFPVVPLVFSFLFFFLSFLDRYSGYLNVSATKRLHYWLVTSENNPDADPTVLWLNGGPGCSSLDGWAYEHGPFRINATDPTQLVQFDYNWNKQANMLYLEAPVGVGFSYSTDQVRVQLHTVRTVDSTSITHGLRIV